MPLNSSLRSRCLEVVGARKNGSFLRPLLPSTCYAGYIYWPVAQSLFFCSKRLCRAHAQTNEAKGSFAKIVGEKEHLLHIYSQLYLHELFHAFRCQTVTSKQSPWITCKESKNTYIKIIPYRSLDLNCNLRLFYSEPWAISQAMHSTSVSIMQCKFTISFTIVSRVVMKVGELQRPMSLFCFFALSSDSGSAHFQTIMA